MKSKFLQSQDLVQALDSLNSEIQGHMEMLKEQALKNTHDIRVLYQEIRSIIDEKEASILHQI